MILTYSFYIILGFLPSSIWLLFYLRKDAHPEPKAQVLRIFVWGMLIAPLAVIFELILFWLTMPTTNLSIIVSVLDKLNDGWRATITLILFAPLVEEYLKYRVVRTEIIKKSHFDEPLDAMLYLIIGALGFAAAENLIIVLKSPLMPLSQAFGTIGFRFLGATLLHALASGIVGYFLAKSFLEN
ncbi:PrsW family intramembrane metalloprotease, partial [bacterium]|nr:PrsW family intramembrane metalloprotease [bacterium]